MSVNKPFRWRMNLDVALVQRDQGALRRTHGTATARCGSRGSLVIRVRRLVEMMFEGAPKTEASAMYAIRRVVKIKSWFFHLLTSVPGNHHGRTRGSSRVGSGISSATN